MPCALKIELPNEGMSVDDGKWPFHTVISITATADGKAYGATYSDKDGTYDFGAIAYTYNGLSRLKAQLPYVPPVPKEAPRHKLLSKSEIDYLFNKSWRPYPTLDKEIRDNYEEIGQDLKKLGMVLKWFQY